MTSTHNYAGIAALPGIKAQAEIHSHEDANKFLGKDTEKQLASNVKVCRRGDSIAIRLYDTDIITYHNDSTFEADNGGFNTVTTANRCTQFGPKDVHFCHYKKLLRANGRYACTGKRFKVNGRALEVCVIDEDAIRAARMKLAWADQFGIAQEENGDVTLVKSFGLLGFKTVVTAPNLETLIEKINIMPKLK